MLYCHGHQCPLRAECYRHTQPSPGRDAFGSTPYDAAAGSCAYFHTNLPGEDMIRQTAYYIWLRSGRPEGRDLEHWYEAYLSLCLSTGRIATALGRGV